MQGDCQASRLSLPRKGEVRELQGDVEIHQNLARDPSSCPMPSISISAGGVVVEELGGKVVESISPENFTKQAMVSHLAKKFSFLECEEMGTGQPRRCHTTPLATNVLSGLWK